VKISVDEDACLGCGLCMHICPEVFEMDYEKAHVNIAEVPPRMESVCKEAAGDCPSSAITITDDEDKPQAAQRPKRWRF